MHARRFHAIFARSFRRVYNSILSSWQTSIKFSLLFSTYNVQYFGKHKMLHTVRFSTVRARETLRFLGFYIDLVENLKKLTTNASEIRDF